MVTRTQEQVPKLDEQLEILAMENSIRNGDEK